MLKMSSVPSLLILAIVTVLAVIQVPLDLSARRLSRRASILATLSVMVTVGVETWLSSSPRTLYLVTTPTLLVFGVYSLVHRISPKSLGLGDVFLVLPLSLAVAHAATISLIVWQCLAAMSGASHAVWTRCRRGQVSIAFGPHLLGAAWVILVMSL